MRPIQTTPPLPLAASSPVPHDMLYFEQDLAKQLHTHLTNMAFRTNATLPKDGSEPMEGDLDMGGFAILNVSGLTVGGDITVEDLIADTVSLRDTNDTHNLTLTAGSNLTANRVFTITTGDNARTLDISAANLTLSGFGATLIDDADAATARGTLGLGTAAVKNTGTSGNVVPLLDGSNIWTAAQVLLLTASGTNLTVQTNDNGNIGPTVNYFHDSSSPALGDLLVQWNVFGRDSAANIELYSQITGLILDATSGSEDGRLDINTVVAGTFAARLFIGAGLWTSGSDGDPGTGLLAATGLRFPATQVASGNANTLDDYEEGTWTPAMAFGGSSSGVTYSEQTGWYTKIGRMVYGFARIVLTNNGSGTGAATITGLPFTAGNSAVTSPALYSGASGVEAPIHGTITSGATDIALWHGSATTSVAATEVTCTNTFNINVSFAYTV